MNVEDSTAERVLADEPGVPTQVHLSLAEGLGLVRAAGREPRVPSPFAIDGLQSADPGTELRADLARAGWLAGESGPIPSAAGRLVLDALALPDRRIEIMLGSSTWWFRWVGLASGAVDAPLVAWSADVDDGDGGTVSFPHPPDQAIELLGSHLRVGRIDDPIVFDVEMSRRAHLCWIGVLDDCLDVQLRAMLDRLPVMRDHFDVGHIGDALAEGRTSTHLAWQTPVTAALWPELSLATDDDTIRAGLSELAELGLIEPFVDGGYQLWGAARELVDRLIPVARWASVLDVRRHADPDSGPGVARLAVRRGLGAMVVEVLHGADRVSVRSIGDTDLELLLLELA